MGGQDHNIAVGNTNAAIIGGSTIKLTGSSYINFTAVSNLAIFTTPSAGGSDDVLTWNSSTKMVGKVTQVSISDERLKKDFIPLTDVVSKINQLNAYQFKYNEINDERIVDTSDYGLIAQEVEKVFPLVVKNSLLIDGNDIEYKTVDYRKLVPILFAAIKELSERIEILEKK